MKPEYSAQEWDASFPDEGIEVGGTENICMYFTVTQMRQ